MAQRGSTGPNERRARRKSLLDEDWFLLGVFVGMILVALAVAAMLPPGW